MFYASPPAIQPGQKSMLCYGVLNASKVRIEPHIEGVGPALSRCVEARPFSTTSYTLKAEDSGGHKQTQPVTVLVTGK